MKERPYRRIDIAGEKYGRLTAIQFTRTKNKMTMWLFQCECGNKKEINMSAVRAGKTKSCGCLSRELASKRNRTHGMSETRVYYAWNNMMKRCYSSKNSEYKNYGERGIKVIERWHIFENFFEDMGHPPKNLSLERIDNDKGYSPQNCKWETQSVQSTNKRHKPTNTGIPNISQNTTNGRYSVQITRNKVRKASTFNDLEEAKKWRETILKEFEESSSTTSPKGSRPKWVETESLGKPSDDIV